MSVQPEHSGSGDIPNRVAIVDTSGPTDWYASSCVTESLTCTTGSLRCSAGEIIVLGVEGEVDLCTVPCLQAALDNSLDQHPAHLVVDLSRMIFCSARGLDLLTQTRRIAAEKTAGYAVSGVAPQIDRVWTLGWDGDLPVRYRSTAAAVTAIRAAARQSTAVA